MVLLPYKSQISLAKLLFNDKISLYNKIFKGAIHTVIKAIPMDLFKPTSKIYDLQAQIDQLKAQLMNNSLIFELTKVMYSCTDQEGIIKTILLGIQEIINFDRVILFNFDAPHFSLRPRSWVGLQDSQIKDLSISLGFEGGEITDAIFLNRHLVVDGPDKDADPFYKQLHSETYLVIPLISKANRKCWEVKNCNKTACPAYGGYNPYCWSIPGSGQCIEAVSENEKRKACIQCGCFKVDGALWMDRTTHDTPITSDDITTLTAISNQAGIILENIRIFNALEIANNELKNANEQLKQLNHELQVAQSKIKTDLEHARTIQLGLLPQDLVGTGFSAEAKYIPADAVGGDYYDVFQISETLYGIVVADVSGHGISSALIMSMVKVLLKTHAHSERSPQKTLEIINQTFLTEIKTDNFVTIFYAILDTRAHTLCYNSAGHCPALFLNKTNKKSAHIKADGLFLGVFPDMMLSETRYTYKPGEERLVLYTDGLTEAKNISNEMFDLLHLEEAALSSLHLPPAQAVEHILASQNEFCKLNLEYEDDITLLVIDL
jgi:serine phosphatase RsbU (regulator of sigma subunit)